MIDKKFYIIAIILTVATILTFAYSSFSQPPRGGTGWLERFDANNNGTVERAEYDKAAGDFFKRLDRNGDGVIDEAERPRKPSPDGPRRGSEPPFPFFVMESLRQPEDLSKAQFEENLNEQFGLMDENGDGVVSREEAQSRFEEVDSRVKSERRPKESEPLDSPTAQFIAAEMRFGDKLIAGAPFSAKIVVEDTRRLFDGSTVTKQTNGAIYRDRQGRTRREQPIGNIGGFAFVGEDGTPAKLVFINDFPGKMHYFLDLNRKFARKDLLPDNRPPLAEKESPDAKTESLGTKMIEGIAVEGTRMTREIPVGQIGNDKPIQVLTEKWFSPELQVVVYSRHVDPIAGEHIFRLVDIKKSEPAADLFVVPKDFRIENAPNQVRGKN